MPGVTTKECTECRFESPPEGTVLDFRVRTTPIVNRFEQRIFVSEDRHSEDQVMAAIQQLKRQTAKVCPAKKLQDQMAMGPEEMNEESQGLRHLADSSYSSMARTWGQLTWKDKINRKRELVKTCILRQATPNLAAIARFAKVHRSTVKKVFDELSFSGDVPSYEYNNVKSPEESRVLDEDISRIEGGFMTVVDLKRRHPSFSRKAILKLLHEHGYRYRLLPKNMKNPEIRAINSTRVCRLVSHIAQALSDPNTVILYIDEMKFPLYQTSERRWQHRDSVPEEGIIYNRRAYFHEMLTAVALCSLEKFEAVQLFKREINGHDFLYFLNTAIANLPPGKHYTIIADNATWHTSEAVRQCTASKFLYFNEPHMFQLNIIENAFSFVRHAFRKRPIVETAEEEAASIMRIFFDAGNKKRFRGLMRNHLRQLEKFLSKHKPQ